MSTFQNTENVKGDSCCITAVFDIHTSDSSHVTTTDNTTVVTVIGLAIGGSTRLNLSTINFNDIYSAFNRVVKNIPILLGYTVKSLSVMPNNKLEDKDSTPTSPLTSGTPTAGDQAQNHTTGLSSPLPAYDHQSQDHTTISLLRDMLALLEVWVTELKEQPCSYTTSSPDTELLPDQPVQEPDEELVQELRESLTVELEEVKATMRRELVQVKEEMSKELSVIKRVL
ncbi:unnamed protein product [Coregonus sp. 'balchen']|nr:unnamed protein product [Coregonus sp. 'balchen']